MNATKLTDLELRIFIAESLGYTQVTNYKWDDKNPSVRLPKQFHIDECGVPHNLPDYTGSRDACYEFTDSLDKAGLVELYSTLWRMVKMHHGGAEWDSDILAWLAKPRIICEAYYEFLSSK